MLLALTFKAVDGANGIIIYSSKFLCNHSMMHNTLLSSVSATEECTISFVFQDC